MTLRGIAVRYGEEDAAEAAFALAGAIYAYCRDNYAGMRDPLYAVLCGLRHAPYCFKPSLLQRRLEEDSSGARILADLEQGALDLDAALCALHDYCSSGEAE